MANLTPIAKGLSSGSAQSAGGLFSKLGFRVVIALISIILIAILLWGAVPIIMNAEGASGKINAIVFEVLAPIGFADNHLYLLFEDASTNGIHVFEKPTDDTCGKLPKMFCSQWYAYNKETLTFIGKIFWNVWFILGLIYIFYKVLLPFNTSAEYRALIMALILYIVLTGMVSPIMWNEKHIGEPIPSFQENWKIYLPAKGLFAGLAFFTKQDSFFYTASRDKVMERIGYNETWNQTV